ncbi:MAG: hypothetical protein ACRD09_08035 [Vicinamibacterales bacterium]
MRTPIGQLVMIVVLLVAGALLWSAGTREARRAQAGRSLATLQYARAAEEHDEVRASAGYWLGEYDAAGRGGDPFLAANAAYRAAVRHGGDWRALIGRLDGAVAQYADVLRASPGHPDAAYNYEFAIRYRAAIAAGQQNVPAEGDRAHVTVHGLAGAPPEGSDVKRFKMIVPMRPEERREAEEAGKSGRRIRKG